MRGSVPYHALLGVHSNGHLGAPHMIDYFVWSGGSKFCIRRISSLPYKCTSVSMITRLIWRHSKRFKTLLKPLWLSISWIISFHYILCVFLSARRDVRERWHRRVVPAKTVFALLSRWRCGRWIPSPGRTLTLPCVRRSAGNMLISYISVESVYRFYLQRSFPAFFWFRCLTIKISVKLL